MSSFIEELRSRLQEDLPGREAQYEMATLHRQNQLTPPDDVTKAGVMALFYQKAQQWHLVFIQRTSSHPNDRHGGQISFPGGKQEAADADMSVTALREVQEEVGIPANEIQLLGGLSTLYIPVSNFLVYPYVGLFTGVTGKPVFHPQPSEVAAILEVPFERFLDDNNRKQTSIKITEQMTLKNVPYFDIGTEHVLWGATAMMMSELVSVAKSTSFSTLSSN